MEYCIGVDLGGTNIVAAVVDKITKTILYRVSCKTNAQRAWNEICDDIAVCCKRVVEENSLSWDEIDSIGIGSPGMVDTKERVIVFASNLPFKNTPLAAYIEERLEKPVYLANDADAAAYGEFVAGAGKGASSMVAVTLGTGIGSGIIINSQIYTGYGYAAGELGHNVLVANGRPCSCGRKGCFEAYASATGLIQTTREHMQKNQDTLMWQMVDGDLNKVSGRTAFDAMRAGDEEGKAVVEEYTAYLSEGIVNIVNALQPEIICLGGGISKEGENLLKPINQAVDQYAFGRFAKNKTKIVAAQLGNDAGIIGAALLEGQSNTK